MKCNTVKCTNDAVGSVYLPGKPLVVLCRACGLRETAIAKSFGFTLSVEPLNPVAPVTLTHSQVFGL